MKKRPHRSEASLIDTEKLIEKSQEVKAYGYQGRVYLKKALGPKQIKEIEKEANRNANNRSRALKAANEVFSPSPYRRWLKRALIGTLLVPGPGTAACATGVPMISELICDEVNDDINKKNREWLQEDDAKQELIEYCMNHIGEIFPSGIEPYEARGKVHRGTFEYRDLMFDVELVFAIDDSDGKFKGSGIYLRFREHSTIDWTEHIFIRDEGRKV